MTELTCLEIRSVRREKCTSKQLVQGLHPAPLGPITNRRYYARPGMPVTAVRSVVRRFRSVGYPFQTLPVPAPGYHSAAISCCESHPIRPPLFRPRPRETTRPRASTAAQPSLEDPKIRSYTPSPDPPTAPAFLPHLESRQLLQQLLLAPCADDFFPEILPAHGIDGMVSIALRHASHASRRCGLTAAPRRASPAARNKLLDLSASLSQWRPMSSSNWRPVSVLDE